YGRSGPEIWKSGEVEHKPGIKSAVRTDHAVQPGGNPDGDPPTRRLANKGRSIRQAPHDHGEIERGDALIAPVGARSNARCGRVRIRPLTVQPLDDCRH